jgi:hypothetical protein
MPQCRINFNDIEQNIGKNLFAIIAAILMLIGVGVFISSIYEYISETASLVINYVFGFIMVELGVGFYFKNKNNFWLGLASCGVIELFISIIISHTYFKAISLTVTFLLIFVWIVCTLILTKVKPLFKIIGYSGFIASMLWGLGLLAHKEGVLFIFLFCAYVGINLIFVLTHKELPVLNLIFMNIGILLLAVFATRDYYILFNRDWGLQPIYIKLYRYAFLAMIGFHIIHLLKYKEYKTSYVIFSGLSIISAIYYFVNLESYHLVGLEKYFLYPLMIVIIIGINMRRCGVTRAVVLYGLVFVPFILNFILMTSLITDWIFIIFWLALLIPAIAFVIMCFQKHDYLSLIFLAIYLGCMFITNMSNILAGIFVAVISWTIYILRRNKPQFGLLIKNYWYLWGLCSIIMMSTSISIKLIINFNWETYDFIEGIILALTFAIITIINLYRVLKTAFNKNTGFNHKPESIFLYLINGIILCVGIGILKFMPMPLIPTLIIILSNLVILSVTILHSLKTNWKSQWLTLLHCFKFTIYILFLMATFEAEILFINVVLLILSITSIVLGFKVKSKVSRIYGLVLALISFTNLVMFSLSFYPTLQAAGGIILCSLLCLGISFIYSKKPKALDNSEKENQ